MHTGLVFLTFNVIYQYNKVHNNELAIYKYLMTHSGYFRLVYIVAFGMEITYQVQSAKNVPVIFRVS